MRWSGTQFAQRFEPGHPRHRQIQQHDVRLHLAGHLHGFRSVTGFANHFQIGFRLQQTTQAIAKNRMVVSNHNSYVVVVFDYPWIASGFCGTVISRREPCPGFDSIVSSPAITRTRSLITNGPLPNASSSV